MLLQNYDESGNKKYGLIDAGANAAQKFNMTTFLANHGVNVGDELEFFLITHYHQDHADKAWAILENYKIKTLYIREFDATYSGQKDVQKRYETIITKAIEGVKAGRIEKIVGISPQSLKSDVISAARSSTFITTISQNSDTIDNNFEGFNDSNIAFSFGSAQMKIFNWKMYYKDGTEYKSGTTPIKERLIVSNENSNSLGLLLTQGNKKAFFAGDLNNADDGVGGPEDRIKDEVGKIDLFKLNHHGYEGSNTESFLNTLNPKFVLITNDFGGMKKETENWLKEKNVNYLYTTLDDDCVLATITETKVFLGFHDTNCFKKINDDVYYIPKDKQYCDYTKECYKIEYDSNKDNCYAEKTANNFGDLKNIIEHDKKICMSENKNETIETNDANKFSIEDNNCIIKPLMIKLSGSSNDWTASESIKIEENQNIILTTSDKLAITISRGNDLKDLPIFDVNGRLSIGTSKISGTITINGNNIVASNTLIKVERGILDLYNNIQLCNNINKLTDTTTPTNKNVNTEEYTAFGSAIYSNLGTINMNGGTISKNQQNVDLIFSLPKENQLSYYRIFSFVPIFHKLPTEYFNIKYKKRIKNT